MDGAAKRKGRTPAVFAVLFLLLFVFMVLDLAQAFVPLTFGEAFWALLGKGTRHIAS